MIRDFGNGKAQLVVSIGSRTKRKKYSKTITYSGKKDLNAQYAAFEAEVKGGQLPEALTIKELLSWYIEHQETVGIKATTLQGYRTCERRINTLMQSNVDASSISLFHIEKFIGKMAKTLSPKTIKNTVSLLSSAYSYAVKCGVLFNNPCTGATIPKKQKGEKVVYTREQIPIFEEAIKEEMLDVQVALLLALYCGLRRSEIMGLEEKHISIPFGRIVIEQTRHYIDKQEVIQDTKSESSFRVVAVPEFLLQMIGHLIELHEELPFDAVSSFLIQDGFGQPMKPKHLGDRLKLVNARAGLPNVTVHGLRHTHATMLNAVGVDMVRISKQLGHSEPSITANVYTHLFENPNDSSKRIADDLEKMRKKEKMNFENEKNGDKMGTIFG